MASVERDELVTVLTPLAKAMRAELDRASWGAYFRVLKDVTPELLEHAVERFFKQGLEFFPKAPEILAECERLRRAQLALYPYEGCAECEGQIGWRSIRGADGYERMERCPCRARHQALLASRGLRDGLAQLPGEAEPQGETAYPTADQLPAELRRQLLETVKQKVLR